MLANKIKKDFFIAYKSKEFDKKNSLGLIKSEILNLEKTKGEATDIDIIKVIKKLLKGIDDSLKVNPQNKELLIEKKLFQTYLPKQLNEDEIKDILKKIDKENKKNIGFIMKYFLANYNGQVDNSLIIKILKSK